MQLVALDVLGTMGCFPKVPLLTDERCQHMSVDFHFGFPEGWSTACCSGDTLKKGGILKKMLHLGCIYKGVKDLKEPSGS